MGLRSFLWRIRVLGRGGLRGLSEEEAGEDPIALFARWFEDAGRAGLPLPEAMTLATATPDGRPSARMMLLKAFDETGFVFYTNYESRKGEELRVNPRAALVFHWPRLARQVRIEGTVERIPPEESEAYFRTRPRGSRVSAWASRQSAPVESREELEARFREFEVRFREGDVPLPDFWGGMRLRADRIEFWQGRANRLHDRLSYTREGDGWRRTRLYP